MAGDNKSEEKEKTKRFIILSGLFAAVCFAGGYVSLNLLCSSKLAVLFFGVGGLTLFILLLMGVLTIADRLLKKQ